jgi:lipopolysaccharide/colanic/teichoic acid biosynthesis glycosyltransferase
LQNSPVERDFASLDPNSLAPGSAPGQPYPALAVHEYAFPMPNQGYALPAPRQERRSHQGRASRGRLWLDRACRAVNFSVALVATIVLSPLMLLIALAVRLSSPGPIFYVQERVGVDRRGGGKTTFVPGRRQRDDGGRIFRIYKFRTMYGDGGAEQVWASKNDPRITPVGRFLRAYRLDELPQLLNVLKGDMNVVGPRPEQPRIFQRLRNELAGYGERQKVLPGITGWAQINHHYDQSMADVERKLNLDLEYISRRSALEDLKIMARTMPVMVLRKGAM